MGISLISLYIFIVMAKLQTGWLPQSNSGRPDADPAFLYICPTPVLRSGFGDSSESLYILSNLFLWLPSFPTAILLSFVAVVYSIYLFRTRTCNQLGPSHDIAQISIFRQILPSHRLAPNIYIQSNYLYLF